MFFKLYSHNNLGPMYRARGRFGNVEMFSEPFGNYDECLRFGHEVMRFLTDVKVEKAKFFWDGSIEWL